MSPEVTVVVPTRNRSAVCEQTLRAVLGQRDVHLEVVVVDEASTDGTAAMLAGLGDDRVQVVRNEQPVGLPAARNIGLRLATAPWIAFCDDDDVWAPDKLRAQLDAAAASGAAWCACGALRVDADLRPIGHQPVPTGDVLGQLLAANVVPGGGSGVLASAALLRELGGFDETLASSEDWELWIRLARRGAPAVVDRPLVLYRIWPGSMSSEVERMRSTRAEVLRRHNGSDAGAYDHERWLAKQLLRGGDRVAAARAYAALAVRHRRPAELVRAIGALVAPARLAAAGDERARDEVPTAWTEEVASW
jgi:glycosyltransferase involved in cell wall biosynthesis